jgi:hydrogenase maturation protein HypF
MFGERIRIRGTVQGVGFRPTVWRIAQSLKITGSVRNDGEGVLIEIWAEPALIDELLQQLQQQLPPLARIDSVERAVLEHAATKKNFEIIASQTGELSAAITADAATCPACLAEINDPNNRRYRYPFTNCTHCGPRFSIINAIPYDRANTSMAAFTMCPLCHSEYANPADRRFHAQPNACAVCGPRVWLQDNKGVEIVCDDVIEDAAALIRAGVIVAIKGMGGFQLACDASNETAVKRLRQRKRRYQKPFALLARDVEMIQRYACVDHAQSALLNSSAAPIVLLQAEGAVLAENVAPRQNSLGFALPCTPLHHLLMQSLDTPIVLTSGNVSDEPQCIANEEALEKLAAIADVFLLHDRDITNRVDDSVVMFDAKQPRMMRRARGYAPATLPLPPGFEKSPPALAMGAELKSTFCLSHAGRAVVSQHIGDLESAPALADYRHQLALYQSLYQHRPQLIVVDKHPNYLSSQQGRRLAQEQGIDVVEVQHHHAHIAAVMAEHGLPLNSEPVLGIALDGLGMGEEGELWGGEFLLVEYHQFTRLASFPAVPLLGGAQAMREPWRNTVAQLLHWFEWRTLMNDYGDLALMQYLQQKPIATLQQMAERKLNTPLCSSAGRLFDAVAAALDLCRDGVSYEGEAAMELEMLAAPLFESEQNGYPVALELQNNQWRLVWRPMWRMLLNDVAAGVATDTIAVRFHRSVINAVTELTFKLCSEYRLRQVVLAGGVFQNRLLQNELTRRLGEAGLEVLTPIQLPSNDGAIAFGQLVVGLAMHR